MPTPVFVGSEMKEIDMFKILPPDEGEMLCIYGRIGSGKTYTGMRRMIDDLRRGIVVYTNIKVDWSGYDERGSKWLLFLGILGIKRKYIHYTPANYHYVDLISKGALENVVVDSHATGQDFVTWVAQLTDCKCYWDEAQVLYDSYESTKVSIEKRNTVLLARHFDKSYVVITQRPSAIHVSLRANVNRFFKMEKTMDFRIFGLRLQHFMCTEFQDTDNSDKPDETRIMKLNEDTHMLEKTDEYEFAIKTTYYWGTKKYFKMYDSKYRRMGAPASQLNYARLYDVSYRDRWRALLRN